MKSPAVRIALGVLAPVLALALVQAWLTSTQNRYIELGLVRAILAVVSDSLGAGLAYGAAAAGVAALLGRPAFKLLSALLGRLPGVVAGLLVAFGAGGLLWPAARAVSRTEVYAVLVAAHGFTGAVAVLASTALAALLMAWLMARRPGAAWALLAFAKLSLLLWAGAALGLALTVEEEGPEHPSVVLVSLDTLRADRTGLHGYPRETTPALDAFAAGAAVFDNAIASSPWTLPSHASMLSGLHPHHHGADSPESRLGEATATLAEILLDRGYSTAAFTGGGYVSRSFGMAQGFRTFRELRHQPTSTIVGAALEWLGERPEGPFFLFVHTYEPHTPYADRRMADPADAGRIGEAFVREDLEALREGRLDPSPAERRYISDLYDGDIRATDEALAPLLARLEEEPAGRVMIIITSDHGEEMFERSARRSAAHGHSLYEELIRIPLVIRHPPAFAGGLRVEAPAGLADIAPTVAGALGIPWPEAIDGVDLARMLEAGIDSGREVVLSEALRSGIPRRGLRAREFKYITPLGDAEVRPELYDLAADPGETMNLAGLMPNLAARFEALAAVDGPARREGSAPVTDPELLEQLKELGYVE